MFSKLLCTDVLAIRCVGNCILVGMGCTLHIFNVDSYKLERKIDCLYPYNIHGIIEGPNNKLTVFGANIFCTYKICRKDGTPMIEEDGSKKKLDDWIIAAKWLILDGRDYLCALLAHNNVRIYDSSNECYQDTWCEEKCILYGGSILRDGNKDLIIFSGTVYQEILIWRVDHVRRAKTSPVLHRLQGHNGVIFSVVYDPETQLICSTSDDRTVRLWKVNDDKCGENDAINWKEADVKLTRTMFGHTARVWKSIIRNKTLITIGEDSLVCTWSLDGKLLNKIYAHHGAAIWSMDISNDDKSIFTGGADGAVHAWPFINDYAQKVISLPKEYTHVLPKYVCYLSSGNLLIFMENGTLLLFDKCRGNLHESLYLEKYSAYCIMEVSPCRCYVCFASRDGYVTMYKENVAALDEKLQLVLEEKAMESQILSVQWLQHDKIAICGTNGILKVFHFSTEGSIGVESVCVLPTSRERWLTAAVLYEELLVCGDRAGNMHVFELKKSVSDNKPIQTFVKIHGTIGVQNFIVRNSKLISAGRDGTLRFYETSERKGAKFLRTLHKEKMPMDWISGHLNLSYDTLVLGFKEVEFVMYSMIHHRTLVRVACGGGHRSWDCARLNQLVTFLYIRNKQVYACDFPLHCFASPVLSNGFHTKEVHCIEPMKIDRHNIFLSGGEDGTVRVSSVSNPSPKTNLIFQTLRIFHGHVSSVKFVTCLNLQSNSLHSKHLVFSGGARAQIKVWEIDVKDNATLLQGTDLSCEDIASHMLYGFDRTRKKQWQESGSKSYIAQPETRYMDIAIHRCATNLHHVLLFVACADGFVRIFLYDIDAKSISLKACAKCADRCITKIATLTRDKKVIALTMSTDGIVRFIDFTDTVLNVTTLPRTEEQLHDCKGVSIGKFNLHQSGINSYDIKVIGEDEYVLATGGDDNLFNAIRFKLEFLSEKEELRVSLISKWSSSTAHVAQITGIIFHEEDTIFSVGTDQQVIMYRYDFSNDALSVTISKKIFTLVTDAKGLTTWHDSKGESTVCVYGKGFEIITAR